MKRNDTEAALSPVPTQGHSPSEAPVFTDEAVQPRHAVDFAYEHADDHSSAASPSSQQSKRHPPQAHHSQQLQEKQQQVDSQRYLDALAMSALVSNLYAAVEDFKGVLSLACAKHALVWKPAADLASADAVVKPLAEVVANCTVDAEGNPRCGGGGVVVDIAECIDSFFSQTSSLRQGIAKITQRLTAFQRAGSTVSNGFPGNSRYSAPGETFYEIVRKSAYGGFTSNRGSGIPSHTGSLFQSPKKPNATRGGGAFEQKSSPGHSAGEVEEYSPLLGATAESLFRKGAALETSLTSQDGGSGGAFLRPAPFPEFIPPPPLPQGDRNPTDKVPRVARGGSLQTMGDTRIEKVSSQASIVSSASASNADGMAGDLRAISTSVVNVNKDHEGNKLINEYLVIGELGRGSYGKVKLVEHKETKELFALKVIHRSMLRKLRVGVGNALQQVQTEIAVMKKLRHRNIVNLYEVIDDPASNKMYLVMQYVSNGILLKMEKTGTCTPLPQDTVTEYARQLAAGINYLHRHNIVHRDIKPENILVGANQTLYLADFGVSEILEDDGAGGGLVEGSQGTPAYMSPELCRGEGGVHGKAVDMWALGVTLYACLFGKLPFYGSSVAEIFDAVQNRSLEFPRDAPQDWVLLLGSLLNKDPNRRLTAAELRRHPMLFGADDVNASSRRASALDIVVVDEQDVENAIAVGSKVLLCCHKRIREKFSDFVTRVRRNVALRKASDQSSENGTRPASFRLTVVEEESSKNRNEQSNRQSDAHTVSSPSKASDGDRLQAMHSPRPPPLELMTKTPGTPNAKAVTGAQLRGSGM